MKKNYDFSNGERGRFYRGSKPIRFVVNVANTDVLSHFEVYSDARGKYRFRLATASTVIFTSEHDYDTKDDCLAAISIVRQDSIIAPTIFQ
jgi:uncharacterized protein YegP (UPF0339 family)